MGVAMTVRLQMSLNTPADELDAVTALNDVTSLLRLLRSLQTGGRPNVEATPWRLRTMRVGSLLATVEPDTDDDHAPAAALRLVEGFGAAEQASVLPDFWTPADATRAANLATRFGEATDHGLTLRLVDDTEAVLAHAEVTHAVVDHLREAIKPTGQTIGSMIGTLGSVSVRSRRRAGLWPARGGARVEVRFREDQQRLVADALGNRAQISGRLHRNSRGQLLRIDMRRLEVLPDPNLLLSDLQGRARGMTEGRGALEHLRRLREPS